MRSVSFVLALGPLVAQGLTYEPHARMEGGYPTCEVRSSESCPLSRMPKDRSTVVYPGGATRCISTKTPYGFQVIPGDASKLLVFFQGGGACWDAGATKDSLCTETAEPSYESGIFDRTNAKNPYREHTVVQLLYCSGDAFAADDARHGWVTAYGDVAVQNGQANAAATIEWITAQLGQGLAAELSDLVLSGDSAGSLATMAWANALLDAFPAASATVLPDSYIGVFPDGCQGTVLRDTWPMCTGPLSKSLSTLGLLDACRAGNVTIQDVVAATAKRHASVPFAFIFSKADSVQKGFFEAIALSMKLKPYILTDSAFYARANDIMLAWNDVDNIVSYAVDGDEHTFTEDPLFYEASTAGPKGGGDGLTLIDWVSRIATKGEATTECAGTLEHEKAWSGSKYCAFELANKTFTRPT